MGGTVFPSPAEAHLEVYIVACFFKGIGMHKTVKVRDIGTPSKIQRCVPAWTGMALFFESRERHRDCSVFLFFFSRGECILPHVLRIVFVGRGYHGSSVRG